MNPKTIYLHVGMQKTATTSIQATLHANREKLRSESFLYPSTWSNWHVNEIGTLLSNEEEEQRRNILYRQHLTPIELIQKQQYIIEQLKNEILESNCENIIISAENIILFSITGLQKLKQIIEFDLKIKDIKIVISLRNIIGFATSVTQQKIKSSFTVNYADIVDKNFYFHSLDKFIQVFGKNNLILYKFEDACLDEYGPVGYFLKTIHFDSKKIKYLHIAKENESVSDKAIDLIQYINQKLPYIKNGSTSPKREIADTQVLHRIRGNKFSLNYDLQNQIIVESLPDRLWLKEIFNIDYLQLNTIGYPKLIFDNNYYKDIKTIFPKLSFNLQKIVFIYILKQRRKEESLYNQITLVKLSCWLKYRFLNEKLKSILKKINLT